MTNLNFKRINGTVIGVTCIIFFIYMVVTTAVIIPWLNYSVPGVLNFGILTINTLVSLFCYYACVLVDPGRVPPNWQPEQSQKVVEVKRTSGDIRFCQKCQNAKPPRSHHCRVCKRCVLRMDHHCPWMNNCIGHKNYKSFILFLLYVNAAILHALGVQAAHALAIMQAGHVRHGWATYGEAYTVLWAVMLTSCMAFTLPLTLGLALLLGWNLYLALHNKTTIEYHEGVTAKIQAAKMGQVYQHPYHLGIAHNLFQVFGPNACCWLAPGVSASGDGLSYPTCWDEEEDVPIV